MCKTCFSFTKIEKSPATGVGLLRAFVCNERLLRASATSVEEGSRRTNAKLVVEIKTERNGNGGN